MRTAAFTLRLCSLPEKRRMKLKAGEEVRSGEQVRELTAIPPGVSVRYPPVIIDVIIL